MINNININENNNNNNDNDNNNNNTSKYDSPLPINSSLMCNGEIFL